MEESNVNSLMSGQVAEVLVEEGNQVEEGQPLVIINSDSLQVQKEQVLANIEKVRASIAQSQASKVQAQAGVSQAQAAYQTVVNGKTEEEIQQLELAVNISQSNLENAKSGYETAQTNFERIKTLYESGISSKAEFETMESALTSAQTALENAQSNYEISLSKLTQAKNGPTSDEIDKAKASVEQAQAGVLTADAGIAQAEASLKQIEASLKEIETNIEKCTLKAPVSGLVTTVNVKKGDMVSSGLPAVVVTDTYHPYISCNVDEVDLSKVSLEQKVDIMLPASEDQSIVGTVVKINKNADFATKKASNDNGDFDILTYGVKVEFEDMSGLENILRSGMTAFVDFGK